MKKLFRLIPFLFVTLALITFLIYNHRLNQKFTNQEVESVIVKRNNWQLRTTEFYLKNGLRIDSTYQDNFDLKIGDSIFKKPNTRKFTVYRKDLFNKYHFYKNYFIE